MAWNCGECTVRNRARDPECRFCREPTATVEGDPLLRQVWALGLSTRTFNVLTRGWAHHQKVSVPLARRHLRVADLVELSGGRLLAYHGLGLHGLDEVRTALAGLGLQLRDDAEALAPAGS